jgi:DNA-directed RNA polymerase specialized sigma24 family protein
VSGLSPREQDILQLRHRYARSVAAIAEILGTNARQIYKELEKIERKLNRALDESEE